MKRVLGIIGAGTVQRGGVAAFAAVTLLLGLAADEANGESKAKASAAPAATPTQPAASRAAATPAPAAAAARFRCTVDPGPRLPARPQCQHGMPVTVGDVLMLPRACRLSLDGKPVDRHTVELRDARTGAKKGQTSLPPTAAAGEGPQVGGILGGPYPLYVFGGGVAAIDPAARKLELVLQAEGSVVGFARTGEILAVAEAFPPDKTYAGGSIGWSVLDFGAGVELGALRVAGRDLIDLGIEPKTPGGIPVWLRMGSRAGTRDLVATLDPKGAAEGSKAPLIQAKAVAPTEHARLHHSGLTSGAATAGTCPAITGRDPVLPNALAVRFDATSAITPARGALMLQAPGCLAATWPDDESGTAWAWIRAKPDDKPAIGRLRCAAIGRDAKAK
ncbi:MAG: hypothetical protein H6747_09970 [Deltaproteobacteria bacterium]|nr:hypothetical protein [Deltaproteobacteria bacterium]